METAFVYNNPKLRGRCICFAYYGSVQLKCLFKTNNMKIKVRVKRYVINENDDNYSPYHYYLDIKTPNGKIIIDNQDSYNYWDYMNRYKPRGTIQKIRCRDVAKVVSNNPICDINAEITSTILYHFENIKKYYKFSAT